VHGPCARNAFFLVAAAPLSPSCSGSTLYPHPIFLSFKSLRIIDLAVQRMECHFLLIFFPDSEHPLLPLECGQSVSMCLSACHLERRLTRLLPCSCFPPPFHKLLFTMCTNTNPNHQSCLVSKRQLLLLLFPLMSRPTPTPIITRPLPSLPLPPVASKQLLINLD